MDDLVATRRSLHGVAELVLAGPQYRRCGSIELRATPGGFGTVAEPDLRVDRTDLVAGRRRLPLTGSFAELAETAGVEASALDDVYGGGPGVRADEAVLVDPAAADRIAAAFAAGDAALRELVPGARPVLWPEHFDIGIDAEQVNYGVSPGDDFLAEPYAYVAPWTMQPSELWNAPFGAVRPMTDLDGSDGVLAFFAEIRAALTPSGRSAPPQPGTAG
ncbi:MAG TPA: hypothetical protein VFB74_31805 [Kribbellaceae bacterium]|nr:hypothetical protein [Kribbellaceae bacterium]